LIILLTQNLNASDFLLRIAKRSWAELALKGALLALKEQEQQRASYKDYHLHRFST